MHTYGSAVAAMNACLTLPKGELRTGCVSGMGVAIGVPEVLAKDNGTDFVCGKLSPEERHVCEAGAVSNVVFKMEATDVSACDSMAERYRSSCLKQFSDFENLK